MSAAPTFIMFPNSCPFCGAPVLHAPKQRNRFSSDMTIGTWACHSSGNEDQAINYCTPPPRRIPGYASVMPNENRTWRPYPAERDKPHALRASYPVRAPEDVPKVLV